MTIVCWVLAVLFALFLIGVLLLCPRTGVEAVGVDGEISIEARYGPFRIPLWPRRKKKSSPKAKAKPSKAKAPKQKKPKKYRYVLNRENLDIGGLIDLALTMLGEMADTLRFSRLRARIRIATDDAAKTGLLLGQSAALTGMIVPFFENTFDMKEYHIDVDADFEKDHTEWAFAVLCSLRPLRLICVVLRHVPELFRWYKRLIKKEEAIQNERSSDQQPDDRNDGKNQGNGGC